MKGVTKNFLVFWVLGLAFTVLVPNTWSDPLHDASKEGDTARVKQLIASGADVNSKAQRGQTPLFMAAGMGHYEVAQLLIEKGADATDIAALYFAATKNHIKMVQLLIEKGADVNARSNIKETPLFWVTSKEMAQLMIAKGAEANVKNNFGITPLLMATAKNNIELVKFLAEKGADVSAQSKWGDTPLSSAVSIGNNKMVRLLIKKGADVNTQDQYGRTPLSRAVSIGNMEMVQLLIAKGADVNVQDDQGRTAFDLSNRKGRREIAILLGKHAAKTGDGNSGEIKVSIRQADSTAKSHLHNIYLACKAMWADKGSEAQCTVKKAISNGLRLDKEVELTITQGKSKETHFEAIGKHKQSPHSWQINYLGTIEKMNSKGKRKK